MEKKGWSAGDLVDGLFELQSNVGFFGNFAFDKVDALENGGMSAVELFADFLQGKIRILSCEIKSRIPRQNIAFLSASGGQFLG